MGRRIGRMHCIARPRCPCAWGQISFLTMYDDFQAVDRWTGKQVHCRYQALIVAIATRHADAVDVKFLVDERPVWIALPHVAWVEYNRQTGKVITDPMAVQIAGHYLKWAIESGEDNGREMYSLTVEETLDHLKSRDGRGAPTCSPADLSGRATCIYSVAFLFFCVASNPVRAACVKS